MDQKQGGLDKKKVEAIAADVKKAMQDIAVKHGLTVSVGGGRYSNDDFKLGAIVFGNKATLGDVDPNLARDMRRYGWHYGLEMEHLNKEVAYGNETLKILGMKGRGKLIALKKSDKKMYYFKPDLIAQLLGIKKPTMDFGA